MKLNQQNKTLPVATSVVKLGGVGGGWGEGGRGEGCGRGGGEGERKRTKIITTKF